MSAEAPLIMNHRVYYHYYNSPAQMSPCDDASGRSEYAGQGGNIDWFV